MDNIVTEDYISEIIKRKTINFPDGYICPDRIGLLITLCPAQYASNDIYGIQRIVSWQDLYNMPLKYRNMAMLCALKALSDEYDFLNSKKSLIMPSPDCWLEEKE